MRHRRTRTFYSVGWRRPGEQQHEECSGLSAELLARRLANRDWYELGPVEILVVHRYRVPIRRRGLSRKGGTDNAR